MNNIKNTIYIAILSTLLIACQATVESEQQEFDNTKNQVSALSGIFPRYSPIITSHVTELSNQWEKASKTSGEDEKIKALQNINKSAKIGNIKPLFDLKKELETTKDDIRYIEEQNTSNVEISVLRDIDACHLVIQNVESKFIGETISDVNVATVEINGFISQLKNANKYIALSVNKIKDIEKEKADAAREADKQQSNTVKENDAQAESNVPVKQAEEMVKCKYCKKSSLASNSKCTHCSAPLK